MERTTRQWTQAASAAVATLAVLSGAWAAPDGAAPWAASGGAGPWAGLPVGQVEIANRRMVVGWALDPRRLETPELRLSVDGEPTRAEAKTAIPRPDLVPHLLPEGYGAGFAFSLEGLVADGEHTVEVAARCRGEEGWTCLAVRLVGGRDEHAVGGLTVMNVLDVIGSGQGEEAILTVRAWAYDPAVALFDGEEGMASIEGMEGLVPIEIVFDEDTVWRDALPNWCPKAETASGANPLMTAAGEFSLRIRKPAGILKMYARGASEGERLLLAAVRVAGK